MSEPQQLYSDADRQIVDHWKCRADGCKNTVPVTAAAMGALAAFNRIEARRGLDPIKPESCVFCDSCSQWFRQKRQENAAKVAAKLKDAIQILKDPSSPTHRLGEAEMYVEKFANEGTDIVKHWARVRAGGSPAKEARRQW